MNVALSEIHWDCECESNYIHSNEASSCKVCGAIKEEQPQSRLNEIEKEEA